MITPHDTLQKSFCANSISSSSRESRIFIKLPQLLLKSYRSFAWKAQFHTDIKLKETEKKMSAIECEKVISICDLKLLDLQVWLSAKYTNVSIILRRLTLVTHFT